MIRIRLGAKIFGPASRQFVAGKSGALLAIASAALFGASTPFAKLLLGNGVDPWLLAGLLYLGSGLALAALLKSRGLFAIALTEAPLQLRDLPRLALIVFCGGILGPILLMLGLSLTPASTAALLLNLEGLSTMLIAWLVFRENVDRQLLLGAFAILAGAAVLSWQGGSMSIGWGALLIAGACFAWGIDNNLTRSLSACDPVQIACIKGLVAGIINFALALANGASLPGDTAVAGAAAIGILGYGVSLVLFILALRHLGAARTSAYYSTAPFIGALLAVLISGEPATARLLLAAGLMAFGVYLHLAERHDHFHAHLAIRHEHRHVHDEHHQHDHGPNDPAGEPHTHAHIHAPMWHRHSHYPDSHHRHRH